MKLTEDDIWINEDFSNDHDEFKHKQQYVYTAQLPWVGSKEEAEQLKQQILDDHEDAKDYHKMNEEALRWRKMYQVLMEENKQLKQKAEKWDMVTSAGTNTTVIDVYQENQRLQQTVDNYTKDAFNTHQENKQLKEELSKTVGDYINLKNEYDNLKKKTG